MHNHQQTTIRLRDGTTRDLLPGEPIPDGAQVVRIRVPVTLRDGVPVRDDIQARDQARDQADQAYDEMRDHLSNAWRGRSSISADTGSQPQTSDEAHAGYRNYLSTAWQGSNR